MFTLVFAELTQGFKRIWKLYLTNVLSVLFIVLMFAYIDGSRRQLNFQNTVFSGEIVVKMNTNIENTEKILGEKIPGILYVAKKIRSQVEFRLPGNINGNGELIGVDLKQDKNLESYLTLRGGRMLKDARDILLPTSIWQKADIKVGDIVRVMGKNADKTYNVAAFKVCGFYNSPGLTLFETPKFLVQYNAMQSFYMPKVKDIEYCLFFRGGNIPETVNKDVREAFHDEERTIIASIEAMRVSSFDVLNISVQMNVFLILLIILAIIVVVTVAMQVNFNIYMILFRKRRRELGTLMSFGVKSWKISILLFLESFFQLIFSTIVAVLLSFLISIIARQQIVGGFLEVMFVLLSGTNRVDFFIQPYQVEMAFCVILVAVSVAQIPIFAKVSLSNPIEIMSGK